MNVEDEIALWKGGKTINDLGELGAQWLEGKIEYQPGYAGRPDEETTPLVAFLAPINRAGVYTTGSQPGIPVADGSGQRAWVEGYCAKPIATKIAAALLETDLVVIATPPGAASDMQLCITIDDGKEFTWASGPMEYRHTIATYSDDLGPLALAELLTAWQLCIIDPVWGRNDLLWARLLEAVQ